MFSFLVEEYYKLSYHDQEIQQTLRATYSNTDKLASLVRNVNQYLSGRVSALWSLVRSSVGEIIVYTADET